MAEDKKLTEMKEEIAFRMTITEYYEILEVHKKAEVDEIKKSYKKLALRFHPDKNSVEGLVVVIVGAKEVFKKVSTAYATLSNTEKRRSYDLLGV